MLISIVNILFPDCGTCGLPPSAVHNNEIDELLQYHADKEQLKSQLSDRLPHQFPKEVIMIPTNCI